MLSTSTAPPSSEASLSLQGCAAVCLDAVASHRNRAGGAAAGQWHGISSEKTVELLLVFGITSFIDFPLAFLPCFGRIVLKGIEISIPMNQSLQPKPAIYDSLLWPTHVLFALLLVISQLSLFTVYSNFHTLFSTHQAVCNLSEHRLVFSILTHL